MSDDTIFDKIINKEISADIVFEDDEILAFKDIDPQAPVHILVIPKKKIPTINDIEIEDQKLIGKLVTTAKNIAHDLDVDDDGYRLVFNCNSKGGQEVYHIHLHLLAGRQMKWPPG